MANGLRKALVYEINFVPHRGQKLEAFEACVYRGAAQITRVVNGVRARGFSAPPRRCSWVASDGDRRFMI
jgi:hypothetical protein